MDNYMQEEQAEAGASFNIDENVFGILYNQIKFFQVKIDLYVKLINEHF